MWGWHRTGKPDVAASIPIDEQPAVIEPDSDITIAASVAATRPGGSTYLPARSTPSELQNVTKRNLSLKVKRPRCANTLFSGRSSGSQIAL